jgi:glycosyltransferase involved in cell wall biosynthesis
VHVLYEYGADFRPHASAHLRLLRPLAHPAVARSVSATFGMALDGRDADVVIVDRLWRPDIEPWRAAQLVSEIATSGARLAYAIDDNLLDLPAERDDWPEKRHLDSIRIFLDAADAVLVTGTALADRLAPLTRRTVVVPHALDERLLRHDTAPPTETPFGPRPITIGYMGTSTHADDLEMIAPALRAVLERHAGRVALEMVGVAEKDELRRLLGDLPVRVLAPGPAEREYPLFQLWFGSSVSWHIAVSPIRDTPFRRCKSDIKFLDYAAAGAAGVYSSTPAYDETVRHGESGLVVDNASASWEAALDGLVIDESLRETIARGAHRQLLRERTLQRCAPTWIDAIDAVLHPW